MSFGLLFTWIWSLKDLLSSFRQFLSNYVLLLFAVVGGMIIHELLHAVTFAAFSPHGFRDITFGFNVKQLAPYVHCKEPLPIRAYRLGTLMPGLVLGMLPIIIALITGIGWILVFGIFFTAGSAGDLLSIHALRAYDRNFFVKDHPTHIGFFLINPHRIRPIKD